VDKYRKSILKLLQERGPGKTICPSEVLEGEDKKNKALMEEVRQSARELSKEGILEWTQKGVRIDPEDFSGPIRLRLKT
jgi:Protein of unknown function (DUF3253)